MLDEHLTALQWLAVICTMLAAAGSAFTARRDRPVSAPADVLM